MKSVCFALIGGLVGFALVRPVSAADAVTFKERVLYSFCSQRNCKDGAYPEASVTVMNGMLYGTTEGGGRGVACSSQGCGTVFALDPNTGVEKVLHSFCRQLFCPDGALPFEGPIDARGTLYGTTFEGGSTGCNGSGCGTVFSLDPGTGKETVLYTFAGGTDGANPQGDLIDAKAAIYGTTQGGGTGALGVVFALDPKTGAERVLYSFCSQPNCADGQNPIGVIDVNATLYGTTVAGGAYNCYENLYCGTVFSLDPATRTETVLHSFGNGNDGWLPEAGLIVVNGALYGTTSGGGVASCAPFGCGTVFSVDPGTGAEKVLYSFCSQQNCADGANPAASLIDVKGTLYGTTGAGGGTGCGGSGCGTVFSIDAATGAETVLYSFGGSPSDGADPRDLIDVKGTFHGTTDGGGAHCQSNGGCGTVFELKENRANMRLNETGVLR